ncbi:hypothetical protein LAD64_26750 [Klebsiella pneumoniae]|nr:hypothetical protein [Klebsiella pneumoniae]
MTLFVLIYNWTNDKRVERRIMWIKANPTPACVRSARKLESTIQKARAIPSQWVEM